MDENNTSQRSSISRATTLDEMAAFWDTHDTAEYWDQFEEVEVHVHMQPRHRVVIDPDTYARVEQQARQRGLLPETLINLWVAERAVGAADRR